MELSLWSNIQFIPVQIGQSVQIQWSMGELLMREGTLFHAILEDKLQFNQERTEDIQKFTKSIVALLGGFTNELTNACRSFFRRLKIDEREEESIIFLSKYIIDILNELAKKVQIIGKKIQLDVMDPLRQFSDNQKKNHKHVLLQSYELLQRVQNNNNMMKELTRNYQINESSINKSNEQKRVLKQIVESEMNRCNRHWQDIKGQYQGILDELNSLNSLRCHFTMKTQIEIVSLINRLVNSPSVEESLDQYQDLLAQNQTLGLELKDEMRQKLGKLIIFQEIDKNDLSALVVNEVDEKQKRIIDDFVGLFTNRSGLKEEQHSYQESRSLILQQMRWTNYFLNKLKASIYSEIQLSNSKFRELASIIKYIFALVVEAQDNQAVLYNLLYISYHVSTKDHYLIKELGKHDEFWKQPHLWDNIINYIHLLKLKGKINHESQPRRIRVKQIFSKANWGWNRNPFFQNKAKSEKVLQQSKLYEILYEVNYYMAKLELDESFIFDFISKEAAKLGINKENTKKLLQFHYLNKMIATNKQKPTFLARKIRLQEEAMKLTRFSDRMMIAVGKSLKYLPLGKDMLNVMLVCKEWAQHLKKNIFKRLLIEEHRHQIVARNRLTLYQIICHPPFSRNVYERMVGEVPTYTEHLELIQLDARRSLGWDQKLRGKMIQVLNTFAFYHPDHGYLQGMNYLCENILKLTDDSYIVYFIFQHLMNNQYHSMYSNQFDGLKLRIYQFMRLLERNSPQLFYHFQAEKIEGEHFILSWAITLWGQMAGDLCWVLWDGFLVEGWHWWFKTILWLLKVLEVELLKMSFEDIMRCFSELHSSLFNYSLQELSEYGIDEASIKDQIDRILIEGQVLGQIEKEYRMRANMINEYLNKQPKNIK